MSERQFRRGFAEELTVKSNVDVIERAEKQSTAVVYSVTQKDAALCDRPATVTSFAGDSGCAVFYRRFHRRMGIRKLLHCTE